MFFVRYRVCFLLSYWLAELLFACLWLLNSCVFSWPCFLCVILPWYSHCSRFMQNIGCILTPISGSVMVLVIPRGESVKLLTVELDLGTHYNHITVFTKVTKTMSDNLKEKKRKILKQWSNKWHHLKVFIFYFEKKSIFVSPMDHARENFTIAGTATDWKEGVDIRYYFYYYFL